MFEVHSLHLTPFKQQPSQSSTQNKITICVKYVSTTYFPVFLERDWKKGERDRERNWRRGGNMAF